MSFVDQDPRPVPPPVGTIDPLPRFSTVERLAKTLLDHGLSARGASAIANATTNPAEFRRRLQDPIRVRTSHGDLEVVQTRLWTAGVVPHPTNTRLGPRRPYAVSESGGAAVVRPTTLSGHPELVIAGASRESMSAALAEATSLVASENPLAYEIGIDGVIEPITAVVLNLAGDTPDGDVSVLTAVDGSSRVAGAYENLDLSADRVAFTYSKTLKEMRGRLGRWLRLLDENTDDLDDDEIRVLNSLTIPSFVVVGFESRSDHDPEAFARAIEARVGAIHVASPKPWPRAAQLDAQLDAVLDALLAAGHIDERQASYYRGDMPLSEATLHALSGLADVRAASLMAEMHRRSNVRVINEALRSVAVRRPDPAQRAQVAAEGALRAFRMELPSARANVARNVLSAVFALPEFRTGDWEPSGRPPQALLGAAVGGDDNAGRELLLLGAYWLSRHGLISSTTRGGDPDRRPIADVLRHVASDRRGLAQLCQTVEDGREGRRPRRLGKSGQPVKSRNDGDAAVSERWLRDTWGSGMSTESSDSPPSPDVDLRARRQHVQDGVGFLAEQVGRLAEPTAADGSPLVMRVGLDVEYVDGLLASLNTKVIGPLSHYRYIAEGSTDLGSVE